VERVPGDVMAAADRGGGASAEVCVFGDVGVAGGVAGLQGSQKGEWKLKRSGEGGCKPGFRLAGPRAIDEDRDLVPTGRCAAVWSDEHDWSANPGEHFAARGMEEGLAQSTGGVCGHADQRVGLGVDVVAERVSGAGAAWQDLDLDVEVVDRRNCLGKLLFGVAMPLPDSNDRERDVGTASEVDRGREGSVFGVVGIDWCDHSPVAGRGSFDAGTCAEVHGALRSPCGWFGRLA